MSKSLVPHKEQSDDFDPYEVIGTVTYINKIKYIYNYVWIIL